MDINFKLIGKRIQETRTQHGLSQAKQILHENEWVLIEHNKLEDIQRRAL